MVIHLRKAPQHFLDMGYVIFQGENQWWVGGHFEQRFFLIFGGSSLIINCSGMCVITYRDIPTDMLSIVAHRSCGSNVERQSAEEMQLRLARSEIFCQPASWLSPQMECCTKTPGGHHGRPNRLLVRDRWEGSRYVTCFSCPREPINWGDKYVMSAGGDSFRAESVVECEDHKIRNKFASHSKSMAYQKKKNNNKLCRQQANKQDGISLENHLLHEEKRKWHWMHSSIVVIVVAW